MENLKERILRVLSKDLTGKRLVSSNSNKREVGQITDVLYSDREEQGILIRLKNGNYISQDTLGEYDLKL